MTKEEFVKMILKEQKKQRNLSQDKENNKKKNNISKTKKKTKRIVKNLKQNDYTNQILMPIIKKFNSLTIPPFPKKHEEYIYNQQDLNFVLNQIKNPYLKIRDIPNWDNTYGKELYLSEF